MKKKEQNLPEDAEQNVESKKKPKKEKNKEKNQEKNNRGRKKKRKKIILIIVVVAIVLLLAVRGCAGGADNVVAVTTAAASRGSLQESISTSGMVAAEEKKSFFAPVSGRIDEVRVAPGDAVEKGDLLVSYDVEELERVFRQAALQQDKSAASYNGAIADNSKNQAKLKEANTNIPVLEQQIADNKAYLRELQDNLSDNKRETANALAGGNYELEKDITKLKEEIAALDPEADAAVIAQKQEELKKKQEDLSYNAFQQQVSNSSDYVAGMELEIQIVQERIADYEKYKAEMESQKTGSESAVMDTYDKSQYEADRELANISYAEAEAAYNEGKAGVCAEFSGVVTEVTAVSGATIAEGTQLLTLESSENVKVSFSASKTDVEKLAVGQKADIIISGNTYTGSVSKINRMATVNASNTPMVGVEIHIDNPDDKIILGLDAKLTVYTRLEEDALLIPVEAVNADKDGDFLYVVENGIAAKKPIVCGISNDTYTVVLEGITEEDQIILTAYGNLEEGMAVTVMPGQ